MEAFILTLHIIACIFLVIVVLMQSGKEGMGVIFGGGSGSLFGSSGAGGLLTKVTALVAAIFICTSLSYNYLISEPTRRTSDSVMDMPLENAVKSPVQQPEIQIEESAPKAQTPEGGEKTAQ
ncbi:MAG: preprotein translocase subunit SecG [Desulfovibrionaceae bacterium]